MTGVDERRVTAGPTWAPQPRPEWVMSVNAVGTALGRPDALVPLDERSLLDAAKAVTGLDDFGPQDEWREPFRLLLADIENEARLNLVGRILTRFDLVRALATLLRIAEAERRNPEILETPINSPVIVTGLARTGTSILHEVMGQDPRFRAPLGWELRYPVPPAADSSERTRRIRNTDAEIDLWTQVVPEFRPIHEMSSEGPDEDSVGQALAFGSQVWMATNRAPSFEGWMMVSGWAHAFRFQRRLLQHLQFQAPQRPWLLKGIYLAGLPQLFAEFPDARVINTHRDPLNVLASAANMVATLRWQRSDHVDYNEIAAPIVMGFPLLLDMVSDMRASEVLPDNRFIDVRFADLMADAVGTVGDVYDQLGIELTDDAAARMRAYLDAKPRGRHGGPGYRFTDMGLDIAEMRQKFAKYMTRFDIPEEPV